MRWRLVAALLFCGLVGACTTSGGDPVSTSSGDKGSPTLNAFAEATNATPGDYRIQPLDMLDVSVFQEPDLSRTVEVSSQGNVTMPLIGPVPAAGKTAAQLQSDIAGKLGAKYLQSPQVTVLVKDQPTQQVTVDGAVSKPGVYPIRGQMTLLQVIATAGGLDSGTANPHGIVVLRGRGKTVQAAKFDYAAISNGQAEDPVMLAGDIVKVDRSGLRAAFSGLLKAIPLWGVFGPLI